MDSVAAAVLAAKEGIYKELTASGIAPFPGVAELIGRRTRVAGWVGFTAESTGYACMGL